mgnify:CR=1 FL=1
MRDILFVPKAFKEYQEWIEKDRKIALKIGDLIRDILRSPFEQINLSNKRRSCDYLFLLFTLSIILL